MSEFDNSIENIYVIPLGGVGRIGMNMTLYGHNGHWIMVDAGIVFPKRSELGINAILPHPDFLQKIAGDIRGLIVTHAHEDHIGCIHHVWPGLNIPIFATPFAAGMIKERLRETGGLRKTAIYPMRVGRTFKIGDFEIEPIAVCHSVPEAVGIGIRCKAGSVLHTGDWRLDAQPVIGHQTDLHAFKRWGDQGLLATISDSTNAGRDSISPTEGQVAEGMRHVFEVSEGRVIVSCFASNLARMVTTFRAAKDRNRQVWLAGRSMKRTVQVAYDVGLLPEDIRFLSDVNAMKEFDPRRTALLCTGTQGENFAALTRMAEGGSDKLPSIEAGDVVIHSARVIPGAEEDITRVFDQIRWRGGVVHEAVDPYGRPLHTTGHATASDIRKFYELTRPRHAIAVHGEPEHLADHTALARSIGIAAAPILTEGDILRLSRHADPKIIGHLDVPLAAVTTTSNSRWSPIVNYPLEVAEAA